MQICQVCQIWFIATFCRTVWILCHWVSATLGEFWLKRKGWRWSPVEVCRVTVSSWRRLHRPNVHHTVFHCSSLPLVWAESRSWCGVYTGQFDPPRPTTWGWGWMESRRKCQTRMDWNMCAQQWGHASFRRRGGLECKVEILWLGWDWVKVLQGWSILAQYVIWYWPALFRWGTATHRFNRFNSFNS